MSGRVLCNSQNGLWLFSPLSSIKSKSEHLRNGIFYRRNLPPLSSKRAAALFCCCSSNLRSSDGGVKPVTSEPFVLTTPLYYHGEKIATAATASGSSPTDHCNNISQAYKMLWRDLDIAYDKFIRTTDPHHEEIVKEFYSRVLANGDIYRADYEGLYCVNCEEYKDEKELLENNCCPMHLKPCVPRKEDNYFFALSKYQKSLEEVLAHNPDFVQPSFRLNEVQSWIKSGLRDFSISRASVDWGIPVPNDKKQTIYVWFDALLGYLSALSPEKENPTLQSAVSSGWPASLHLIGKDILRFHAVYWPAMLMSAGLSLPKVVFGHGFLTKDGMKMGKSLGNTLEPKDLVLRFGSDAVRYFFLREVELGNDGDYSEDRFINIVNAHLANTIGNLLNRTLGLLKKNCRSTVAVDSITAAEGSALKQTVEKLVEKAKGHYESLSLSLACEAVLEIGNAGNMYMDERAPWSLFKQGGAASEAAAKDLVIILEAVRIIAVALSPVTPSLCSRIWGGLKEGQVMAQPTPIFARIENKTEGEDGGETGNKKAVKDKKQTPQGQVVVEA
ncbi:Valyl/Leucyl/Isoleucyl-tRNA synthetase [Macleaya cordata]|uniref:methionine--tRNA ligase n=1 Tax=Macleaya cordata TaxID=56857 RepID=A0A200R6H5_MACCD|nr:Valyl/Leucyl/Isoleucyl-tRNA synthetase [Macleaya cordata]